MRIVDVRPYRFWRHIPTGQRVSLYGAVPYVGEADKADWEMAEDGYTYVWDNGTVGTYSMPRPKTEAEALEVKARNNARLDAARAAVLAS